jgi:hypothetical protein
MGNLVDRSSLRSLRERFKPVSKTSRVNMPIQSNRSIHSGIEGFIYPACPARVLAQVYEIELYKK